MSCWSCSGWLNQLKGEWQGISLPCIVKMLQLGTESNQYKGQNRTTFLLVPVEQQTVTRLLEWLMLHQYLRLRLPTPPKTHLTSTMSKLKKGWIGTIFRISPLAVSFDYLLFTINNDLPSAGPKCFKNIVKTSHSPYSSTAPTKRGNRERVNCKNAVRFYIKE